MSIATITRTSSYGLNRMVGERPVYKHRSESIEKMPQPLSTPKYKSFNVPQLTELFGEIGRRKMLDKRQTG